MSTVDLTTDNTAQVAANFGEHGTGITISRQCSFSDFAASGDDVQLIAVPENSFVAQMYTRVVEAFDGTSVLIVGDDNTTNGYAVDGDIAETSINTVHNCFCADATGQFVVKGATPFYTSDDTIDVLLTWSTTPTVGILQVVAVIVTIP